MFDPTKFGAVPVKSFDANKFGAKPLKNGFPTQAPQEVDSSFMSKLANFGIGVVKGAGNTVAGIGSLGKSALDNTAGRFANAVTGKGFTKPVDDPRVAPVIEKATTPTNTAQKIGFGAEQIGEFFIPGATGLKVSKGANLATKVLASGLESAGITALQGGSGGDTTTAGVIGAVSPILGLASKLFKSTKTVDQALGQIAQGTTKDVPIFKRALDLVNTKGVKTFEDLKNKFDEIIPNLASKVDDELAKDTGVYALDQLTLKAKNKAGQQVVTDYVTRGLNQLSELYSKIGDDVSKSDIDNTIAKALKDGLTRKEVNNISRVYGIEFGQKAFNRLGEPLTSVNAQNFENTRKGLKTVARQGLGGKEAKILDSKLSDVFDAKALVEKNVEAVNKLKQKIDERGLLEKLGNNASKVINTLTGGTLRGIVSGVLGSNVGNKVMNSVAIEKALQKNLSLIEKTLNAKTEAEFVTELKSLLSKFGNIGLIKGGLELQRTIYQN